jgi:hypothetical protein
MDIHNAQHTGNFSVAGELFAFQPGLWSEETVGSELPLV